MESQDPILVLERREEFEGASGWYRKDRFWRGLGDRIIKTQ